MALEQGKKKLINISFHTQFRPLSNVVLNEVQLVSGMWSSDLHPDQRCAKFKISTHQLEF